MENIVLTVHLILALALIGVVLLQRSEGGALGLGGGGGGGGLVSSRGAATALSKLTWVLAACFIATSIALTILAGGGQPGSILERFQPDAGEAQIPLPTLPGATAVPGAADVPAPADLPLPPAAPTTPPIAD